MDAVLTLFKPLLRHIIYLAFALVVSLGIFMLLPLLQIITDRQDNDLMVRQIEVANLEPPPPPQMEEEEPEPEPEPEPPPPAQAEPLSIEQMELANNPGFGGFGGGDFEVNLNRAIGGEDGENAIFSLSDLDQKPRVVYQPAPIYPQELARKGLQGTVYILFLVGKDGRTRDLKVQKSTHPSFNAPALKAVKQWKFEPGKRKGKPVQFRMRVPITFQK